MAPRPLPPPPSSLALFAPDPGAELARAREITKAVPMFARFEAFHVRCKRVSCEPCKLAPSHGPYFRALWVLDGKVHRKHIGDAAKLADVQRAHEVVRLDLVAQGIAPPKRRTRRKLSTPAIPTPEPQKPNGSRGGSRPTARATLRDSGTTHRSRGDGSAAAANGSRRRS